MVPGEVVQLLPCEIPLSGDDSPLARHDNAEDQSKQCDEMRPTVSQSSMRTTHVGLDAPLTT